MKRRTGNTDRATRANPYTIVARNVTRDAPSPVIPLSDVEDLEAIARTEETLFREQARRIEPEGVWLSEADEARSPQAALWARDWNAALARRRGGGNEGGTGSFL